jgi:hypothetical protein
LRDAVSVYQKTRTSAKGFRGASSLLSDEGRRPRLQSRLPEAALHNKKWATGPPTQRPCWAQP